MTLPCQTASCDGFDIPTPVLTPREREVIGLIARGMTNKLIGQILDISADTAKFHVVNVIRKFHANNRAEVVATAIRMGLV